MICGIKFVKPNTKSSVYAAEGNCFEIKINYLCALMNENFMKKW